MMQRLLSALLFLMVFVFAAGTARADGALLLGARADVNLGKPASPGCDARVKDLTGQNLVLFANGQPIPGARAWFDCDKDGALAGHALTSIAGSGDDGKNRRKAWQMALGSLSFITNRTVDLAFGTTNGTFATGSDSKDVTVTPWSIAAIDAVAFVLAAGLFIFALAFGVSRDPVPEPVEGVPLPRNFKRTYSLSRTQLVWWTVIVVWSYAAILVATGAMDTITAGTMGLMGIVGGASVLSFVQSGRPSDDDDRRKDYGKAYRDLAALVVAKKPDFSLTAQPVIVDEDTTETRDLLARMKRLQNEIYPTSNGFIDDVLTDAHGMSAHRLQLLVWTGVLGIAFLYEVARTLSMPELSPELLALTGISHGTYFGFKMNEQQVAAPEKPDTPQPNTEAGQKVKENA
ncbi:hypothetical protein [Azospirillum sp. sgz301742]